MIRFLAVGMFLILFTLKLCGVIAWSWWFVTAPLWLLLVWAAVLVALVGTIVVLDEHMETTRRSKRFTV